MKQYWIKLGDSETFDSISTTGNVPPGYIHVIDYKVVDKLVSALERLTEQEKYTDGETATNALFEYKESLK